MKFKRFQLKKWRREYLLKTVEEAREWKKMFTWHPIKFSDSEYRWFEYVMVRYPKAYSWLAVNGNHYMHFGEPEYKEVD